MDDLLSRLGNSREKLRLLRWLLTVPEERVPATMEELADEEGMPSSRTLRNWKRDDAFVRVWRGEAVDVVGSPERTQRVLEALESTALDGEHKQHVAAASAWLKAVGAMTPPDASQVSKESDLASKSKEELLGMAKQLFGERLAGELAAPVVATYDRAPLMNDRLPLVNVDG